MLSDWAREAPRFMLYYAVHRVNVNCALAVRWSAPEAAGDGPYAPALMSLIVSNDGTVVAFALCGAMLGFAPFNRPVARLFLSDVRSLPIGLLLAWLLILLAERHLTAALLLPLYYLADSTIPLVRRIATGEQVTQAHRSHFYQCATDNGFSVIEIVGRVFALNVTLAILAAATVLTTSPGLHIGTLLVGCALVSLLLCRFTQAKPR